MFSHIIQDRVHESEVTSTIRCYNHALQWTSGLHPTGLCCQRHSRRLPRSLRVLGLSKSVFNSLVSIRGVFKSFARRDWSECQQVGVGEEVQCVTVVALVNR